MSTPFVPLDSDFSTATLGSFNFAKKLDCYNNNADKYLVSSAFKYNKKPLTITFDATIASDKILVAEFDTREVYSLPIELEDEDQLSIFTQFADIITSTLNEAGPEEEYDISQIVKDDKIYLKIKFGPNQKTPAFKTNIAINNKKIGDTKIYQGQKVTVTANVNYYFNFDNHSAGPSLTIRSLIFETNEEDDEVSATPKRKAKDQLAPETPRKPRTVRPTPIPKAIPFEFEDKCV